MMECVGDGVCVMLECVCDSVCVMLECVCVMLECVCVMLVCVCVMQGLFRSGKTGKSVKIKKGFPVTRKSGNIEYSPTVRESQGI